MKSTIDHSIQILERTPAVLQNLLQGLSNEWTENNEGVDTWSPFDVIGHLIHGEKTDWLIRADIILSISADNVFPPFDRFSQFEDSKGKSLGELLQEFESLRITNIQKLRDLQVSDQDFEKTGVHPTFGKVTLSQLLATWVVHDLDHIYQVVRVMAKQYKEEVGPWIEFLKILHQ